MKNIRVVIADDHHIVREGIRTTLEQAGGIQVVGEAGDGEEAVRLVQELAPDILLLDVEMPRMDGIEVMARLREMAVPVQVLVISAYADDQYILSTLNCGACGYLVKDDVPKALVQAVQGIAAGEREWLSPSLRQKLAAWQSSWKSGPQEKIYLTSRQLRVLFLFLDGRTGPEIAAELSIDPKTLEQETETLLHQFGAGTLEELVQKARL